MADQDELSRCQDELRELKDENEHLREAARSFGELAERLRDQLHERRSGTERRHAPPDTGEARGGTAAE